MAPQHATAPRERLSDERARTPVSKRSTPNARRARESPPGRTAARSTLGHRVGERLRRSARRRAGPVTPVHDGLERRRRGRARSTGRPHAMRLDRRRCRSPPRRAARAARARRYSVAQRVVVDAAEELDVGAGARAQPRAGPDRCRRSSAARRAAWRRRWPRRCACRARGRIPRESRTRAARRPA